LTTKPSGRSRQNYISNYYEEDKYAWITGLCVGLAFLVIIALVIVFFTHLKNPEYRAPPSEIRSAGWSKFHNM